MKATLRAAAERRGLLIGAAVEPRHLGAEPVYGETLAREFNALVAENVMKFRHLQPERGRFDFAPADRLLRFAGAHGMAVRGHTLVWHNSVPEWLENGAFSKREALDLLRAHIFTVLGHFRGSVFCWDVVNEALSDDGGWREKSVWHRLTGIDYLEHAFRWAHEADPSLKLFYNDYGMELSKEKAEGCHRLLKGFLDRGVPVHGVGFQYHLGVENKLDPAALGATFRRFADLGLEIHLTELDMGIKAPVTDALRREQAEEYGNRMRIALACPAVKALMFWGFTDRHSWIPSFTKGEYQEPLLFDESYRPKAAYEAVLGAL